MCILFSPWRCAQLQEHYSTSLPPSLCPLSPPYLLVFSPSYNQLHAYFLQSSLLSSSSPRAQARPSSLPMFKVLLNMYFFHILPVSQAGLEIHHQLLCLFPSSLFILISLQGYNICSTSIRSLEQGWFFSWRFGNDLIQGCHTHPTLLAGFRQQGFSQAGFRCNGQGKWWWKQKRNRVGQAALSFTCCCRQRLLPMGHNSPEFCGKSCLLLTLLSNPQPLWEPL